VEAHLEWVYSSLQRAGGISQWKREIPSQENLCVYIHSQTFAGKSSGLLKTADSAELSVPVFSTCCSLYCEFDTSNDLDDLCQTKEVLCNICSSSRGRIYTEAQTATFPKILPLRFWFL
jgi:hypothetical protein